jgi:hypothetical protein
MITTSPNESAFRSSPAFAGQKLKVDRENNIIYGASILQSGPLNDDRPWEVDDESLAQVVSLGNRPNRGTKARVTHPNMSNDGFGSHLGRWQNFRIDGDTVRADLHISDTAFDAPKGDIATYVMDLAEDDPEAFGVSIATSLDFDAMEETETDGVSLLRVAKLRAADIVDEPAATRGGLFSVDQFSVDDIPGAVTWLLDNHFSGASPDVVRTRFESLLSKYYSAKGEVMSEEQNVEQPEETVETEVVEENISEVEEVEAISDGQRFLNSFGEQGGVWFAEGKTFDDAQSLFNEKLREDNDRLREHVAQLQGQVEAADFGEEELSGGVESTPPSARRKSVKELENHIGKPAAELAGLFADRLASKN